MPDAIGPTPGSLYTVQPGDTLTSIAQQAYNDQNPIQWQNIYIANFLVIGNDPNKVPPGMTLFIPNNRPVAQTHQSMQFCTITTDSLNIRATPNRWSAPVANFLNGTTLNFVEVVNGEMVADNPLWGHSVQGHYYWLGGTDHPNG